ncbi:putative fibroblast growth factor 1 [Mastacembelus armatus]|uniref:Fibroblast growth factor n=1 Tax=Mastacembelus armatus TaxID=205130 RepID=A0A7N8Y0A0_9TELE|nr:putative fibroblast growth factor 1 [Mastacembelus armatus]
MQTPDRCSPLVVSSRKSHCRAPTALTERFLPLRTMTDGEMFVVEDRAEDSGLLLRDYGRFTRLYCMNGGFHLQILPDGTVQGQRDDGDVHIVLKLKAVDRGVVVIQGTAAERYLAMSDEGRLYASPTVTDECYFLEKLEENHYNTYQPQKYQERNWYVALKKNGKPKLGPRTHIGQKAIFFLPRQLDDSGE